MTIKIVGNVEAGTMGNAIAQACSVVLLEKPDHISSGILRGIHGDVGPL